VTTAYFWRAQELAAGYGAVPIAEAAAIAQSQIVEVMVHPSLEGELEVLCSNAWLDVVTHSPLGSYRALSVGSL
jgi:hypothetical protein